MLNRYAKTFFTRLLRPLARALLARGVHADWVSIVGTIGVVGGALEGDRFGWPAGWLGACAVVAALRWRDYARARRRDGAGRR